jgi:23S rRNA A2030 N6-methylase RlmJ
MTMLKTRTLILVLIAALVAAPLSAAATTQDTFAEAEEATGAQMAADLLLVRPVGIAATLVGSAIFIVALPFTLISGDTQHSLDKLIKEPGKYTFNRPLGYF